MRSERVKKEIDNITRQIIQKYKPARIILFGSAARGEYDKINDLDFLIIKEKIPLNGLDRLRELEEMIERDVAADMLVYRPDELDERIRLGDPFITNILKEGLVLYG